MARQSRKGVNALLGLFLRIGMVLNIGKYKIQNILISFTVVIRSEVDVYVGTEGKYQ